MTLVANEKPNELWADLICQDKVVAHPENLIWVFRRSHVNNNPLNAVDYLGLCPNSNSTLQATVGVSGSLGTTTTTPGPSYGSVGLTLGVNSDLQISGNLSITAESGVGNIVMVGPQLGLGTQNEDAPTFSSSTTGQVDIAGTDIVGGGVSGQFTPETGEVSGTVGLKTSADIGEGAWMGVGVTKTYSFSWPPLLPPGTLSTIGNEIGGNW